MKKPGLPGLKELALMTVLFGGGITQEGCAESELSQRASMRTSFFREEADRVNAAYRYRDHQKPTSVDTYQLLSTERERTVRAYLIDRIGDSVTGLEKGLSLSANEPIPGQEQPVNKKEIKKFLRNLGFILSEFNDRIYRYKQTVDRTNFNDRQIRDPYEHTSVVWFGHNKKDDKNSDVIIQTQDALTLVENNFAPELTKLASLIQEMRVEMNKEASSLEDADMINVKRLFVEAKPILNRLVDFLSRIQRLEANVSIQNKLTFDQLTQWQDLMKEAKLFEKSE